MIKLDINASTYMPLAYMGSKKIELPKKEDEIVSLDIRTLIDTKKSELTQVEPLSLKKVIKLPVKNVIHTEKPKESKGKVLIEVTGKDQKPLWLESTNALMEQEFGNIGLVEVTRRINNFLHVTAKAATAAGSINDKELEYEKLIALLQFDQEGPDVVKSLKKSDTSFAQLLILRLMIEEFIVTKQMEITRNRGDKFEQYPFSLKDYNYLKEKVWILSSLGEVFTSQPEIDEVRNPKALYIKGADNFWVKSTYDTVRGLIGVRAYQNILGRYDRGETLSLPVEFAKGIDEFLKAAKVLDQVKKDLKAKNANIPKNEQESYKIFCKNFVVELKDAGASEKTLHDFLEKLPQAKEKNSFAQFKLAIKDLIENFKINIDVDQIVDDPLEDDFNIIRF